MASKTRKKVTKSKAKTTSAVKKNKTSQKKKVVTTKVTAKKITKPVAKKAAPKKKVVVKKPAKKAQDKKIVAKKAPTKKKPVVKKTAAKKAPAKKKIAPKKTVTKKPLEKKLTVTKKTPVKPVKKVTPRKEEKPTKKEVKAVQKPNPDKKPTTTKAKNTKPAPSDKAKFKAGDFAIYPSHGIGKITGVEKNMIMGEEKNCYLMHFEKERLSIKIPVSSAEQIGLRSPINKAQMDEVFVILRSGIKKLKGMWSRRAQEYETKINSGDITLLAEVIRDLTRDIEDSERSYSERIIYETAIYRLASEYSIIYGVSLDQAKEIIINTAKDKIGSEGRISQSGDFDDEFDAIEKKRNSMYDEDEDDDEEEEEEEEEEDEDSDDDDGDDDDDYDD